MVGQEILVLFIMVRIRAPQPKIQPANAGFIFVRARIRQSEAHGEYADEQLATAQKRIFLIEFLRGVGYCLSRSRAHSREQLTKLWHVGET